MRIGARGRTEIRAAARAAAGAAAGAAAAPPAAVGAVITFHRHLLRTAAAAAPADDGRPQRRRPQMIRDKWTSIGMQKKKSDILVPCRVTDRPQHITNRSLIDH